MFSENHLPTSLDPFRLAERAKCLRGKFLLKQFERLCTSLGCNDGEVVVEMQFGIDACQRCFLRASYETTLRLICQRCAELFDYKMVGSFLTHILRKEAEVANSSKEDDFIIINDQTLVISDLIEDEIITNLPIVPMHAINDCSVKMPFSFIC